MTERSKESIRNNIKKKIITQSLENKLRDYIKNERNETIIIDSYQTRKIISCKEILKRDNKKRINQT